jgi:predicted phosphodiesterase
MRAVTDCNSLRRTLTLSSFAVVSDLHVGRPDSALSFRAPVGEVANWVDDLLCRWGLLVVNGDLYDLDRGVVPFRQRDELAIVELSNKPLIELFRRPEIVWLVGNHDEELLNGAQAERSLDVRLGRALVRIEHGDRFDAPVKRSRAVTRLVTWASGRVVRGPFNPVYSAMRRAESLLTGEYGSVPALEQRALRWLMQQSAYQFLVLGHTHRAGVTTAGNRGVLNPGDSPGPVLRALGMTTQGATLMERRGELRSERAYLFDL